jgi:oligopeptide transport system substrate-binding protein
MYMTGNGNNRSGYSNKAYDALIEKAAREQDMTKRLAIFDQAEAILMDDVPVMPIYIYTRTYLKRPEVEGWYANVEDVHPLKFVKLSVL